MAEYDDEDFFEEEGRGRSRRKREAAVLKDLGDELVRLPEAELALLPLDEKLRDAIELARRITAHGGAARQRQLIGKILRRIETWRNRLVAEGEPAVAALLATEQSLDAPQLRRLVETARHEASLGRPPAAARELFRWLRETLAADGANP